MVRNLPASAGSTGSIPGLGRSPGGGNGKPLQYSRQENWTEEPGRLQTMESQRVRTTYRQNNNEKSSTD